MWSLVPDDPKGAFDPRRDPSTEIFFGEQKRKLNWAVLLRVRRREGGFGRPFALMATGYGCLNLHLQWDVKPTIHLHH